MKTWNPTSNDCSSHGCSAWQRTPQKKQPPSQPQNPTAPAPTESSNWQRSSTSSQPCSNPYQLLADLRQAFREKAAVARSGNEQQEAAQTPQQPREEKRQQILADLRNARLLIAIAANQVSGAREIQQVAEKAKGAEEHANQVMMEVRELIEEVKQEKPRQPN